jgi:glycosyltransferase involved in cell wall biosynthesis
MKIETYILCRNEELFLPYLVRHYSQYGKIIILENNSTDSTVELAKKLGCEVWIYSIPDYKVEKTLDLIRKKCWQDSKADWVMIIDADEFIYHPDLLKILTTTQFTVFEPEYVNMFSDKFPTTCGQIYDEVQYGASGGIWKAKMNLFSPRYITDMCWDVGGHYARPKGRVNICYNSGIKTLHYKFMGSAYVMKNFKEQWDRKLIFDRKRGYGAQYGWSEEEINNFFEDNKPFLKKQV